MPWPWAPFVGSAVCSTAIWAMVLDITFNIEICNIGPGEIQGESECRCANNRLRCTHPAARASVVSGNEIPRPNMMFMTRWPRYRDGSRVRKTVSQSIQETFDSGHYCCFDGRQVVIPSHPDGGEETEFVVRCSLFVVLVLVGGFLRVEMAHRRRKGARFWPPLQYFWTPEVQDYTICIDSPSDVNKRSVSPWVRSTVDGYVFPLTPSLISFCTPLEISYPRCSTDAAVELVF